VDELSEEFIGSISSGIHSPSFQT